MEAVEVVYRLHLSLAYQTRRDHMEELLANTMRIVELAPVNPLNARMYAHMPAVPVTDKYKVGPLLACGCECLCDHDCLSKLALVSSPFPAYALPKIEVLIELSLTLIFPDSGPCHLPQQLLACSISFRLYIISLQCQQGVAPHWCHIDAGASADSNGGTEEQ